jgi:hypothetical protein
MNTNNKAIKNQVNNRISHELTTILPRLRGLHSLMMQAPLENTEEMHEFSNLVVDFQRLMPSNLSSASASILPRPKTPENSVSIPII